MSGGSLRLDDAIPGLENLEGILELKVGVLEAATNAKGQKVAEYAAANEFGVLAAGWLSFDSEEGG